MDNSSFVNILQGKIAEQIQNGLKTGTISRKRGFIIADAALSNLYPSIGKDHLLLAKENFLKIPELKSAADDIEAYVAKGESI